MTVNEYGLGEPDGAAEPRVPTSKGNLKSGLESSDADQVTDPKAGTEFGLGDAESQPDPPVGEEPQPPKHGLGS